MGLAYRSDELAIVYGLQDGAKSGYWVDQDGSVQVTRNSSIGAQYAHLFPECGVQCSVADLCLDWGSSRMSCDLFDVAAVDQTAYWRMSQRAARGHHVDGDGGSLAQSRTVSACGRRSLWSVTVNITSPRHQR